MTWVNQRISTYQTYLDFERRAEPKPKPEPKRAHTHTYRTKVDEIESRYSINQIREMYAKYLAGRKKSAQLEDIAKQYLLEAMRADIDEAVRVLAENWRSFTNSSGT